MLIGGVGDHPRDSRAVKVAGHAMPARQRAPRAAPVVLMPHHWHDFRRYTR